MTMITKRVQQQLFLCFIILFIWACLDTYVQVCWQVLIFVFMLKVQWVLSIHVPLSPILTRNCFCTCVCACECVISNWRQLYLYYCHSYLHGHAQLLVRVCVCVFVCVCDCVSVFVWVCVCMFVMSIHQIFFQDFKFYLCTNTQLPKNKVLRLCSKIIFVYLFIS